MSMKRKYYCKCGKGYAQRSSLSRHRHSANCKVKVLSYVQNDIAFTDIPSLIALLHEKDKQMRDKDKEIAYLRNELRTLIGNTAGTKPSVGTINNTNNTNNSINITTTQIRNILTECSTGPALTGITDMSLVFNEDDELFLEDIAYDHRHKILYRTIGDSIVNIYKTPNPMDQSVWNTDCNRLNYLIKHAIGKKKAGWIMDKMGLRVVEYVISPVLWYLKEKMNGYAPQRHSDKTLRVKADLLDITKDINDGTLAEKINKYIAGHFYMTDHIKKAITFKPE